MKPQVSVIFSVLIGLGLNLENSAQAVEARQVSQSYACADGSALQYGGRSWIFRGLRYHQVGAVWMNSNGTGFMGVKGFGRLFPFESFSRSLPKYGD